MLHGVLLAERHGLFDRVSRSEVRIGREAQMGPVLIPVRCVAYPVKGLYISLHIARVPKILLFDSRYIDWGSPFELHGGSLLLPTSEDRQAPSASIRCTAV